MDENKKTCEPLAENELDAVTGGVIVSPPRAADYKNCHFNNTGEMREDAVGNFVWWRCDNTCSIPFIKTTCACYGTPRCVDKWHRFTTGGSHK